MLHLLQSFWKELLAIEMILELVRPDAYGVLLWELHFHFLSLSALSTKKVLRSYLNGFVTQVDVVVIVDLAKAVFHASDLADFSTRKVGLSSC